MKTSRILSLAVVLLLLAVRLETPAQEKKDPDQQAPPPPRTEQEVRIALMRRVKQFPGIKENGKTTIKDALDILSKEYSLRFRVEEEAFGEVDTILEKDVPRKFTYSTLPISRSSPAVSNRSVYSILRMVLQNHRWPIGAEATFAIRGNTIVITTEEALRKRGLCPEPPPNAARSTRAHELYRALHKPVKFPGFEKDEQLTFEAALTFLEKQYGLTFEINDWAFLAEIPPVKEVKSAPVADKVGLPRADRTTPALVLQALLSRVPTVSGTVFVIQHDCIAITTVQDVAERYGVMLPPPPLPPPLLP